MITSGEEKRDFLYAEDCCSGFETVMKKFDYLKQYKVIDLNYGHYTKIIKVAKIIKNIFFQNEFRVKSVLCYACGAVRSNLSNTSYTISTLIYLAY